MKITQEQILKMHRKIRREEELENSLRPRPVVHKSKKTYNRKKKHKGKEDI